MASRDVGVTIEGGGKAPSPNPYPILISITVFVLSLGLIYQTWIGLNEFNMEAFRVPLGLLVIMVLLAIGQGIADVSNGQFKGGLGFERATLARVGAFLGLAVAFVVLLPITGYVVTGTVLFASAVLLTVGVKNYLAISFCAVLAPLTIYLAFGVLFSIWLPAGTVFEGLF